MYNNHNNYGNYRNTANNFQRQNPYVSAPNQTPQFKPQFKKSWAVYSVIKNGKFEGHTIVNAFKKTRNGLLKAVVSPYEGKKKNGLDVVHSNGKSGSTPKEYQKMICVISNSTLGTSNTYPVLMNLKTKVIVIKELGLCITPNGNGVLRSGKNVSGYFGKNYK